MKYGLKMQEVFKQNLTLSQTEIYVELVSGSSVCPFHKIGYLLRKIST